jgi:hypothetical protein
MPPSVKLPVIRAEAACVVASRGQKKECRLSLPESPGMRVGGKRDLCFGDLGALAQLLTEKKPKCHTPRLLSKEVIMKVVNRFSVIAGALAAVICSSALEAVAQQQLIIGCVKPGTGLLRIPSGNEGCKAEERPLGFNDLPLLVALRNQVQQLQERLTDLEECQAIMDACMPPPE